MARVLAALKINKKALIIEFVAYTVGAMLLFFFVFDPKSFLVVLAFSLIIIGLSFIIEHPVEPKLLSLLLSRQREPNMANQIYLTTYGDFKTLVANVSKTHGNESFFNIFYFNDTGDWKINAVWIDKSLVIGLNGTGVFPSSLLTDYPSAIELYQLIIILVGI